MLSAMRKTWSERKIAKQVSANTQKRRTIYDRKELLLGGSSSFIVDISDNLDISAIFSFYRRKWKYIGVYLILSAKNQLYRRSAIMAE